MRTNNTSKFLQLPLVVGILVGLLTMAVYIQVVNAAPLIQEEEPVVYITDDECKECHIDVAESWAHSPHAHAFDDPYFQERWTGMGSPSECLLCHTTNFQATTGEYSYEGISCEECHGQVTSDHPPAVVQQLSDSEYCGKCHTTTLSEWRLTGHAASNVGCMDCHDPHSQGNLFEVPDDLCINCHQEDMDRYLEDIHIQKGIGCVDCHALVIPPEEIPDDGIVPTGHSFIITPATCVACHTDTLHAGFSLPGYENGASSTDSGTITETVTLTEEPFSTTVIQEETSISTEQRIQALEAALANRQLTTLIQGGVIGLVLGGSTAWFLVANVRRGSGDGSKEQDSESQEEESEVPSGESNQEN